jgi:MFS transporter, ACS family, tartrate transporter
MDPHAERALEQRTIHKAAWRLLPLVIIIYLVNYVDRTNISVASLTMNKDLGLSSYTYGWGAGIFFIGYALFEVPSNVILEKVGARLWIARIMITWGIISGLMALVAGPVSFLTIRFLLGVAEAGFFPGVIFYFTNWFPAKYRGRAISGLFIALPIANGLASILSAIILGMDGILGLRGWQWVFIIEAIPPVLLAIVVLAVLHDRPETATWLAPDERAWLSNRLAEERGAIESRGGKLSLRQGLADARVLALATMYLTAVAGSYGVIFFLPQIVKQLGFSNLMTGVVSSFPFIFGLVGLLACGWSSDHFQERRWHLTVACFVAAIGLAGAGFFSGSYGSLVAICIATLGFYGSRPPFWPMPSLFLTGTAAAAGIALVNSIGNLGGYLGPLIVGWMRDATGDFEAPLYVLAASALMSGLITLFAARASRGPKPTAAGQAKQSVRA